MRFTKKERTIMATLLTNPSDKIAISKDVDSLVNKGIVAVNDGQVYLIPVKVEINIAGCVRVWTMHFDGIGAYPYPCIAKDRYPNDPVFRDDEWAWLTLRDYDYVNGVYKSEYGVI